MIQLRSVIALGALVSAGVLAQGPPPPNTFTGHSFEGGDFVFFRTEGGMQNKIVKSSPYSAQSVTEYTQTLADGNRIHRSTAGSIARDSEGRTRREQTITGIGQMASSGQPMKSVMIHDPVARATYELEPHSHSAHVTHEGTFNVRLDKEGADKMAAEQGAKMRTRTRQPDPNVKSEDLGTQVMEGVTVQGKRVTRTVPAGEIGNDRALDIVTETWFSPDLQVVVMSRTSDPRSGESVYKLTGISRAEPDRSLFEVPADYQTRPDHGGEPAGRMIRRGPGE